MIACSWLFSIALVAPIFWAPSSAFFINSINSTCLPPSGFDDMPWIYTFGICGFLLPLFPLIGLPICVWIKRRKRFQADRRKFQEKVSCSHSITVLHPQYGVEGPKWSLMLTVGKAEGVKYLSETFTFCSKVEYRPIRYFWDIVFRACVDYLQYFEGVSKDSCRGLWRHWQKEFRKRSTKGPKLPLGGPYFVHKI